MIQLLITSLSALTFLCLAVINYKTLAQKIAEYQMAKSEYELYFGEHWHNRYHIAKRELYNTYLSIVGCYCLVSFFTLMFLTYLKTYNAQ